MRASIQKIFSDESGAVAIEYALIASIISTAIIAGMQSLSPSLSSSFGDIATNLISR